MNRQDTHKVYVNPTPSSIIEASEPTSPRNNDVFNVSSTVVDSLVAHANEINHIQYAEKLFLELARLTLSRRSADPEQLLMDYLSSKHLPELHTLPHHRASSSIITTTEETGDFSSNKDENEETCPPNTTAAKMSEGHTVEERLVSCGDTDLHKRALRNVARLLLTARPHDPTDYLVTRWEGLAFGEGAEDTVAVEASSPSHGNSVCYQLESCIPAGTAGSFVAKQMCNLLLSKKPSNPLNFLFDYYSSRLGRSGGESICSEIGPDHFSVGAAVQASQHHYDSSGYFPASRSESVPKASQKSVVDDFRRRCGGYKASEKPCMHRSPSVISDHSIRHEKKESFSIVKGGGGDTVLLSSMKSKEDNRDDVSFGGSRNKPSACVGRSPVSFSFGDGRPSGSRLRNYDEDPLIEVSYAMKRNVLPKSPPPPPLLTECAVRSLTSEGKPSAVELFSCFDTGRGVGSTPRAGQRRRSPPFVPQRRTSRRDMDAYDEESGEEEEEEETYVIETTSTAPKSAAAVTLNRELNIFQAKREFRIELMREELSALAHEKTYREMMLKRRPSEEGEAALEQLTELIKETERYLRDAEAHYNNSLKSLTRWIKSM